MLLSRVVALAVDLRPGEGRLTALLLLLSALLGFVRVYLNTAAIALFLTVFGAGDLPYLFIASAAASALTGLAFSKAQDRLPLSRLLTATLAILLVTIGLLRALLLQTEAEWPTMALAVWNEVIFVIAVLAFWALAEQLVNVRQAKRLFGVIGAGEVAASIVGGFTLPFLVDQIGTKNLVLAAAVAAALSFCVLQVIVRSFGGAIDGGEEASGVAPNERETGAVRLRPTDRYFLLIAGVCALNTVGFYVVDTAYFAETERQYPDEDELAAFLGVIEAVSSAITLVGRTFMTGRVLSRFGVTLGLLTLPLVMSVGTLAIVGTASVGGASALVFWLMVLTKVNFGCLHESLDRPSILVLYQPLPPLDRLRAQTWVETITDPLALGLTGGVLLLFEAQFGLSAISLSFLILLVVLLWATVAMFIGRSYLAALQRALAKRYLGGGTRLVKDRSMTAVLEKGLGSRHPGEVIYSLNVLEELEHESLPLFLESLLEHPVATVRQDVLARIERLDLSALADRVLDGVERDPSPAVRAVALQAYAALGRAGVVEHVTPYLGHPEPDIRVGALIGLLRSRDAEAAAVAGGVLRDMAGSDAADRVLAARAIGGAAAEGLADVLAELLRDRVLEVRRSALVASGAVRDPSLWPLVVQGLAVPALRDAAARALERGGDGALPALEAELRDGGQDRQVHLRIARIRGQIGGPQATAALKGLMTFPDARVRQQVLLALRSNGYRAAEDEVESIRAMIEREVAASAWTMAVMLDIGDDAAASLLRRALAADLDGQRDRLFLLLGFIYPAETILQVRANVVGESTERRAYALEVLDNVLSSEHRALVMPLVDDTSLDGRLRRLRARFPQRRVGADQRLAQIVARPLEDQSFWTKASAIHVMGSRPADGFRDAIISALADPEPVVRETAVWALARLGPADLAGYLDPLTRDRSTNVAQMARFAMSGVAP